MMKSEKMWDQLAKNWGKPGVRLGENDLKIIELAKKHLNPSHVVLDYGCATGSIALEIAGMAKEVHGIDISSNMIEIAKSKADEMNIKNIGFARRAIFDESLEKESFDVILALNILHLVENSSQVMERVNQLLKPGGIFISATPCLGEKTFLGILMNIPVFLLSRVGVIPSIAFFSASSLTAAITNADLQMIEQKDLSVRPLRECFIVARNGREPEDDASSSLIVLDVGSLAAEFSQLYDSRKARGNRYQLAMILTLIVLAKVCGEDKPSGIVEWVQHRIVWLCKALPLLWKKMPHRSSYERILEQAVSWEELEQLISRVLSGKYYFGKQVVVAIDGKVLRGTLNEKQEGVYLLAAYLPGEGIVLMEVAIKGKGQEIEAAPQVLKSIDLRDKVVMGDALHTQRAVSIQIVEAGGEYVWFVKGNQPQLEENLRLWFGPDPEPIPGQAYPPRDFETAQSVNKGHERIEQRTLTVSSQLSDFLDWPYQEQVFKLERRFIFPKTGEVEDQVVYGITSLTREEVTPRKLLQMTRSYWGIENGLHYRRDVTLHEDQTRMTRKNAARIMACLNNLVLGLLIGKMKYRYLPQARRFFAAHPNQALALMTRL